MKTLLIRSASMPNIESHLRYHHSNTGRFILFADQLKEAKCAQIEPKHETVRKDLPTYSADDVAKKSDE
jgi:hypothetical protein